MEKKFIPFPKMARLTRECIITEKLDGTNAQICITEDGGFFVGSRTRWIVPGDDNYGFAKWAYEHKDELMQLGVGSHFGEWWGKGIQRNYGMDDRKFSLFNTLRWCKPGNEPRIRSGPFTKEIVLQDYLPACCDLVPELYRGEFQTGTVANELALLSAYGSVAAPDFMKPEGVVVFHVAAGIGFKKTIDKDHEPKGVTNGK